MCKSSLLVRITFSFFPLFSLSVFLLPVHFHSLFDVHVKMSLELLKYIHTQRKRKNTSSRRLFLSHSFSRNSSVVCICMLAHDQCMDITSHTNTRTYIIKRKEANLRPEQKLALISFSLSLLFLFFCSFYQQ